ncbi:MAG: hypothetical protein AWU57_1227 [Marinobacter sp. T13-3]|nr:MAG: hypothetical protein AWU57_1227 [Marinobacter sp. T13-3]
MTTQELIERLKEFPPQTPVLVVGYETGFDDIVELKSCEVVRYRHAQEWDGEYQTADRFSGNQRTLSALVLTGRRGARRS